MLLPYPTAAPRLRHGASRAVRGAAAELRANIVKEGVLDPLVLMARAKDPDVLSEVAAAFATLSSVGACPACASSATRQC